jgi:hypothetical protein
MKIHIYCNPVAGGWLPEHIESGLGGSEESLVLLARSLGGLGARVTVYHNRPPGTPAGSIPDGGGCYLEHGDFEPGARRDALITWKERRPWQVGARGRVNLHLSAEVEAAWHPATLRGLDRFLCLTPYHRERLPWLPDSLARVVPLGIDTAQLERHRHARGAGALYCSSPDRGLERLLLDWPAIRRAHPGLALRVTYGWALFDACAGDRPEALRFKARLRDLLRQDGVEPLGRLPRAAMAEEYWRARYWLLPLERPDAELFCLNAIKARHCGAAPVVRPAGALAHSAPEYLDYGDFVRTPEPPTRRSSASPTPVLDWDAVVKSHWLPLLQPQRHEVA